MKRPIIALLVIVIIVLGAVWYANRSSMKGSTTASSTPTGPTEKMNVSTFDVSSAIKDAPAGFPADLPIETANVTEQNKLDYPDRGTTLYSISYTSEKSLSALSTLYKKYFSSNKYTLEDTSTSSPSLVSLQSDKGSDSISVVITPNASGSTVQLGLVHRQTAQ